MSLAACQKFQSEIIKSWFLDLNRLGKKAYSISTGQ